jgi:VWFA-related protein
MKKRLLCALFILSMSLPLPFGASGQTQSPATGREQQDQKISLKTAEVILDAVVKDKKGRLVKDLRASDFEVYEDGARQQIESFRLVTRKGANSAAPIVADKESSPARPPETDKPTNLAAGETDVGVSAIALVFDRLSPDARKRARDAAMSYVGDNTRPDDFIGVFNINLSLSVLQNYTTDNRLVRQGIEKAGISSSASFSSNGEMARAQGDIATAAQNAADSAASAAASGGAGAAAAGAASGAASVDQKFAEMAQRTLETFEVLERNQQGYATSNSLLAVVNSMRSLPGRKAVIFFSEGLSIPPNVLAHFRSVINQANRINVSLYTIDIAGLRVISGNQEARKEIEAMGRKRVDADSRRPDLSGPMTAKLEHNEDLLRSNPQSGLMQLAHETGGTFIGDTNNVGARLKQVDEDMHSYYLLTYAPANQNLDGKFREISIKLKRNDLEVQTRKGYYAVNAAGYVPMLYYETSALAALNATPAPTAFPIKTLGVNFPEAARSLRTAIEVEVPITVFTFVEDKAKKTFSTNFTILALIKDQSHQVVGKLSRQYALTGPLDKMKAARTGNVLFYRETELPPGRYDIEAVAYDQPSDKASVTRSSIEIHEADEGKLRLSTVSIVERVEQLQANQKSDSPFQVGEVMLYPNFGEPFKKSATKQVGFYFVVYPAKGAKAIPQLTLQVIQGSKMPADLQLKLSPPDAQGRIPYASALPIESLNPGSYELRITVKDGQTSATRSQTFTIEP